MTHLCPCHSQKEYCFCCEPYHRGDIAPTTLALMRSRYAAYALSLATYVQETSGMDPKPTLEGILEFCEATVFEGLEILAHCDEADVGYVTFFAKLSQGDLDVSFTEKSLFLKRGNRWFYCKGATAPGRVVEQVLARFSEVS